MLKKWICFLWALAMVLNGAGKGRAEEKVGSIRIMPQWCGTAVSGGAVSLSRVGVKSADGYYLTDGLANWSMEEADLHSEEWVNWFAGREVQDKTFQKALTEEGALFEGLQGGVYLVEQTETDPQYLPFQPFFLVLPEGENWDVYRRPKVVRNSEPPKTGDRPAPIIAAMALGLSIAVLMVMVDEHKK